MLSAAKNKINSKINYFVTFFSNLSAAGNTGKLMAFPAAENLLPCTLTI